MSAADKRPIDVVRAAIRVVAADVGLSRTEVRSPSRHEARRARRLVAYLSVVAAGVRQSETARGIGLASSTLVEALHQIEDQRDDPQFDARLQALERRFLEAVA